MFSHLAEKASFVNYLPLLTQATSDDGEPTPGYLIDEMRNLSFQSVSSSQQLVDYLIHRLNKASTPVKIKVLKIIINLINNGHVSFRQNLRQHDGSIKNAILHSGTADPLMGNVLYKDVQKLAQETLDLMFNPEIMKEEEGDVEVLASIESSVTFLGGMGASACSSGKYDGFGNTLKEREGTVADKMLDYLGRLIHPTDEQTSEVIRAALHSSPGDYQPVAVANSFIEPVFATEPPPFKTQFIKNHIPGRAGGGWESDEDEHDQELGNTMGQEFTSKLLAKEPCGDLSVQQQVEHTCGDNGSLQAQETLAKFFHSSGIPSIDELDEACAKLSSLGYTQVLSALPEVYSEVSKNSNEESTMRILLLWEWLYHYDHTVVHLVTKDVVEMLDTIGKDQDLPSACRSKAKKLKILHEKSELITNSAKLQVGST